MDGRGYNARPWLCDLWYFSNILFMTVRLIPTKTAKSKQKKTKQKNNRNFTERTVCFWTTKNKVKRQLTTTLTTVTSRSHESPVPESTISYLLGIVDFGQARKKWLQKK